MTRCGSNLLRGRLARAFSFHPLGFVFYPVLGGLCFLSAFPDAIRQAFARRLLAWQRGVALAHAAFWVGFLIFGLARWAAVMTNILTFPTDWL